MKRIAGIVLYNPDVERLKENMSAILPQVDELLLIENGSHDTSFLNQFEEKEKVVIIRNDGSKGIAYALNQILGYAYAHGYDWALTLDQDSVVSASLLDVYEKYTKSEVGIIGCQIVDRNFKDGDSTETVTGFSIETDWIITSASYTSTKVWREIGGFDSQMFIDWVDTDYCTNIRVHGYKVLKVFDTYLLHELGDNTSVKYLLGRKVYVMNKPVFRVYYTFRNFVYLARKYPQVYRWIPQSKQTVLMILTVLFFEKNRLRNAWAIIKGLVHGFIMPLPSNS